MSRREYSPNPLLEAARCRLLSPSGSGRVMSRQELAEAVNAYLWRAYEQTENLDRTDIGRLERGENRWPGERRREAFRAVLNVGTDADLGFHINRDVRSAAVPSGAGPAPGAGITVVIVVDGRRHPVRLSRRDLVEATAASLIASLLDGSMTSASRIVNPAVVDHFTALRALLVDSDNQDGPGAVLPAVHHQLDLIAGFRRQARGDLHQQLLRCEARWAEFAGWLSDDLGDGVMGGWWLGQAMSMAHEAEDPDFSAYLFARMAQRAVEGADQDRALGLAEAATRVGTRHRHVRAFAALQRGHGYAAAGESRLFEAAVAEAQALVHDRPAGHGDLGEFCTPAYLLAEEAEGWLRLRQPKTAVRRFDHALDIWPAAYERDRGLYLSRASTARLMNGEPDHAATMALAALELATTTRSARIRREVATLGERLSGHRHRPAVQTLLAALAVANS